MRSNLGARTIDKRGTPTAASDNRQPLQGLTLLTEGEHVLVAGADSLDVGAMAVNDESARRSIAEIHTGAGGCRISHTPSGNVPAATMDPSEI